MMASPHAPGVERRNRVPQENDAKRARFVRRHFLGDTALVEPYGLKREMGKLVGMLQIMVRSEA
jgi:hypothetical protein